MTTHLERGPTRLDSNLATATANKYEGIGTFCSNVLRLRPSWSVIVSPCCGALIRPSNSAGTVISAVYVNLLPGESEWIRKKMFIGALIRPSNSAGTVISAVYVNLLPGESEWIRKKRFIKRSGSRADFSYVGNSFVWKSRLLTLLSKVDETQCVPVSYSLSRFCGERGPFSQHLFYTSLSGQSYKPTLRFYQNYAKKASHQKGQQAITYLDRESSYVRELLGTEWTCTDVSSPVFVQRVTTGLPWLWETCRMSQRRRTTTHTDMLWVEGWCEDPEKEKGNTYKEWWTSWIKKEIRNSSFKWFVFKCFHQFQFLAFKLFNNILQIHTI